MNKVFRVPNSLAFRSTILVGFAVVVCLTIMHEIVVRSIEQHFTEQDAGELNEVFVAVNKQLAESGLQKTSPADTLEDAVSGHHGVYYHVESAMGDVLYTSKEVDFSFYPEYARTYTSVKPEHLLLFKDSQHMFRATKLNATILIDNVETNFSVIVASNMEFHMTYMDEFKKTLWLITLCAAVITILAARFAIYRGHSPLRKLSRKIETISADHLDARISSEEVPMELLTLVDSFNVMLQKLEDGFVRLSFFSADIAHELRTPITNLTTQTQVMLSRPRSNEQYTEMLYSNLEEFDRMTKMVSDMLLLAQTEHGLIKPNKENIDVNSEIKDLLEYFELLADEKNISLQLAGPTVTVNCDRTMLRQALSNLISNAVRYSPVDNDIVIETKETSERVSISVINQGETISKKHLARLFDRFYRADPSRKRDGQGAGLGLTIAKSVIRINGGDILATSSENEITFTITFSKSTRTSLAPV
ncbi:MULTISPECIES: heavy metal sensor histidine kinase [Alteromonadaceae]|uniref:Sensor protein n=1 Tax=Brumicola blandensis TaxID=3075611 RepID=A0AAW8QZU9_9ALTE|nr:MULTISPECIES: heavy metal sensor histidine kinase [unclassified Alteromonas]MDT0581467.1 heavy metal sensor histidine kinase [Alteromonas sp. W409]MDT0627085.1 heavy metal sensor histidine kinase [Alteromonas sp. W364]